LSYGDFFDFPLVPQEVGISKSRHSIESGIKSISAQRISTISGLLALSVRMHCLFTRLTRDDQPSYQLGRVLTMAPGRIAGRRKGPRNKGYRYRKGWS